MNKSKLGISVGLLAAICYFLGLISSIALVIAVGYVLINETDEWLRKCAIKAITIYIVFTVLSVFIGMGDNAFNFFDGIIDWVPNNINLDYPLNLDILLGNALDFMKKLFLIILGLAALKHNNFKMRSIDDTIEKHM